MEEDKYTLTFFEVCEKLNKSKKTISRYVRKGFLHPIEIKSQQGTLEYRFGEIEVERFKLGLVDDSPPALTAELLDSPEQTGQTRQDRQDTSHRTDRIGQTRHGTYPTTDHTEAESQSAIAIPFSTKENEPGKPEESPTDQPYPLTDAMEATEQTGQSRQDGTDETGQTGQGSAGGEPPVHDEVITLLKETVSTLKDQLQVKDSQIHSKDQHINAILERNRELNVLLNNKDTMIKGLHHKLLALEAPGAPAGTKENAALRAADDEE